MASEVKKKSSSCPIHTGSHCSGNSDKENFNFPPVQNYFGSYEVATEHWKAISSQKRALNPTT